MDFCESELWNSNLTWYTDTPQFTECFQSTVLVYTPAGVLVVTSIMDIYNYIHSRLRTIPWSVCLITKMVLTAVCLLLAVIELSSSIIDLLSAKTIFMEDLVAPLVKIFSYCLSLTLIIISKHFGQVYSPAQFIFWCSNLLCQGLVLFSLSENTYDDINFLNLVLLILNVVTNIIMFFLNCFADKQPLYADLMDQVEENPCPKKFASFPSRVIFAWFDQLMLAGWKNPLTLKDLWNLNPEDKLSDIVPALEKHLYKNSEDKQVSIMSTLFRCYWKAFVLLTILYIIKSLLQLANPQIINLFISFLDEDQENWKGYLYMIMFGVVSFGYEHNIF